MGANDLYETSSISSRKAFELDGETQLKITPPITAKKMTLRAVSYTHLTLPTNREV